MIRKTAVFIFCVLLGFSGCAGGRGAEAVPGLPRFEKIGDAVYRGGRPAEEGWLYLDSLGVRTVISFEEVPEKVRAEKSKVLGYGMDFLSLPVSLFEAPSDSLVIRFLDTVLDPAKQPVFIHCENGKDRTSFMTALYRVTVQGREPGAAYDEAKDRGFWPYRGDVELKKFMLQLKDRKPYFERVREWRERLNA